MLAVSLLLAGIILLVAIQFMNFTPAVELGLLLFFGLCGALYLVGRGRSFLLQYHAIEAKIEAENEDEKKKAKRSTQIGETPDQDS